MHKNFPVDADRTRSVTAWLDDGDVRLYHGDALEQLALMPSESVQCIVTSPPFWGLRDYGTGSWEGGDADCDHLKTTHRRDQPERPKGWDGAFRNTGEPIPVAFGPECGRCGARRVDQQIGLEETPDEWCNRLVQVMREARRVLRRDGVCWIEVGDTYNGSSGNGGATEKQSTNVGSFHDGGVRKAPGLKPKDLVGAPWLLAFALRADGWYLRSDTIWARPNPMPESVTDRPTKAHSYVFLLTKSARYFYDADAIREPHQQPERSGTAEDRNLKGRNGTLAHAGWDYDQRVYNPAGRNARSVWSIPTEPTPFAHFATFPQALVERCIKAGTSEHGACSECGAPWRRITDVSYERSDECGGYGVRRRGAAMDARSENLPPLKRVSQTMGWEPSCACLLDVGGFGQVPPPVPCVVLDPFMGSGTTALVARRLNRHAIGIELNPEYLAIAAQRLQQPTLWSDLAPRS